MATTTSPDNIFVLESSDSDTPSSWQPAMATSVQDALNSFRGATSLPLSNLFVLGTPAQSPEAILQAGWVQLQGAWQVAGSGGRPDVPYNSNATILTLPVGWRPDRTLAFPSGPFGAAALIVANVRVHPTGDVEVYMNNTATGGATGGHFPLGAVRFRVGN